MLENLFRTHFSPNPSANTDEFQREMSFQRSKSLVYIQLTLISCLLLYRPFVLENELISCNLWTAFGFIILIGHLLTVKNYHKQFKMFYNVFSLAMTMASVNLMDESVLGAYIIFFLNPLYFFNFSGDMWIYVIQGLGQIINLALFFKGPTTRLIEKYGVEKFVGQLMVTCIFTQVMTIFIIKHFDGARQLAYKRASQAEMRKDETERQRTFLLSFTHELRNLLNSVIGSIELSLMEDISIKMRDILHGAQLCGKVLQQEIHNILDSGKLEMDELEIIKKPVATRPLLNNIWTVCSELIKRKNLNGHIAIDKTLPPILEIDEGRLTQIVLNLTGNAVKFTEKGGIDIYAHFLNQEEVTDDSFEPLPFEEDGLFEKSMNFHSVDQGTDSVCIGEKLPSRYVDFLHKQSGILKLIIKDSGCGMNKEECSKLFKKFSQVGDKNSRSMGTGLGLFISRHIAHKMKGDIRVYSQKDKGTIFIVNIPANVPNEPILDFENLPMLPTLSSRKNSSDRSDTKNLTCLIVDDDDMNIQVLRKFLSHLNVRVVETATNGLMAVEKYKKLVALNRPPHLITMDIYMPEMDGKTATREIRRYELINQIKATPIVMISANCTQTEINDCLDQSKDMRAQGFLKKPVNIEEFKELISSLF